MSGSGAPPEVNTAKRRSSSWAGPHGHPFHPIAVTVPVGAYWLIGVGLIGALLAAVFGLLDLRATPRGTDAYRTAIAHLALNALVVSSFLVGYLWRAGDHLELEKTRWGQLALSGVAVSLLVVSVWLGGTLVYRFGVRLANEHTHAGDASRMG